MKLAQRPQVEVGEIFGQNPGARFKEGRGAGPRALGCSPPLRGERMAAVLLWSSGRLDCIVSYTVSVSLAYREPQSE